MIHNYNKKCSCCQQEKPINCFPKNIRNKDLLDTHCKICKCNKNKTYRERNKEKFSVMRRKYYSENIEKMREEKRKYGHKNKEKKKVYDIDYRKNNSEKIKNYKKKWETKHRNDPIFKIKRNLRRRVHHVLSGKRKSDKTFNLIGCSASFFKEYIESLWKEGMSWDNYGPKGWHIDHIVPCHRFNLLNEEEQRKCFHYSNQRPLWAYENLSRDYSEIPTQE
jgi:hypothetical protein